MNQMPQFISFSNFYVSYVNYLNYISLFSQANQRFSAELRAQCSLLFAKLRGISQNLKVSLQLMVRPWSDSEF